MSLLSIQITEFETEPGEIHVRIESPAESEGLSRLPFEKDVALPAILKALEAADLRSAYFDDGELTWLRDEKFVKDYQGNPYYSHQMRAKIGQRLFYGLFPTEKMRGIYDQVRRQSTELGEEMQIQLRFDAGASLVGAQPWELLYHERDFLVGGGRCTLTRYITFDTPPPMPDVLDKLTVLLVTPRPIDPELAPLGDVEAQAVSRGVKSAEEKDRISVEQLPVSSFSALKTCFLDRRGDMPHVVHFDGHGVFGRRCAKCKTVTQSRVAEVCRNPECREPLLDVKPQGYLAFEDVRHRTEYVSAQEFADLLRQAAVSTARDDPRAGIRLVLLSACGSAVARGGESVFNGVAQRLMDARVPAVLAVQFSIRADAAAKFAEAFYSSIAEREPLVTAVSWGRTVLGREGDQWYRPVLYLRWRDNEGGQLFGTEPVEGRPVTEPVEGRPVTEDTFDEFLLEIDSANHIKAIWRSYDGTALPAYGKVGEDERLRRDISRYINMLRQGGADLRPDDMVRLGSLLYETLFPAEIGALFERALDAVTLDRRRDLWLRAVIDVDPRSEVFLWPLELLYCERKGYWLGAESQIALSRRTFGQEMKLERQPPPLPVLVVMSDPKDPDLGGKTTTEVLKKMAELAGTGSSKKMDIKLLGVVEGYEEIAGIDYLEKPATYVNLERSMDWRPRVLHFIGHGKCEQSTKEGSIGLVDLTGGVDWCSAEDISRLLQGEGLRLVLLQGCREAVSGTEPGFVYFSKSLTQRNIPAVVGMQYTISNEFATLFAEGFYQALLMGKNLDQAVQSGRKRIWNTTRGKRADFGAPVLFTYNPDGIIRL